MTSGTDAIDPADKDEHRRWSALEGSHHLGRPGGGRPRAVAGEIGGGGFTLLGLCAGCAEALPAVRNVRTHLVPDDHPRDTLVLVRPDGYIGMVAGPGDVAALQDYVDRP